MKIILFAFSLLLSLSIFAQQPRIVISSIKAPSHKKQYSINERIIVYYSDTCAVGGNINQISKEKIMIDSAFIPTNSIQYIVDYNKKNFWHKMGGIGMIIGGSALIVGGSYLIIKGFLPFSKHSFYLIPGGLIPDIAGVILIGKGISNLSGKGKQYEIGYKYLLEIEE